MSQKETFENSALCSFRFSRRSEVTDRTLADEQSSILSAESTLKTWWIGLAVNRTDKWCFSGFGALVKDDEIAGDFVFIAFFCFDIRLGVREDTSKQKRQRVTSSEVARLYHLFTCHCCCKPLLFSSLVIHCWCLLLSPSNMPPAGIPSLRFWSFLSPSQDCMFLRMSVPPSRHSSNMSVLPSDLCWFSK